MPEPALDGRAMVGVVVAGWDSDRPLRRGISRTWARKLGEPSARPGARRRAVNSAPSGALDDGP
ncbi:hypothetical protein ACFVXW_30375 [Streptomyces sp. NPDC058251]|uniref:hypothetical protein n=1 Tax=unclassified Streptomyces TaxID=2593676 RepID=UPI00364F7214